MAGTKTEKITAETTVTVAELALILGLSSKRVRDMAGEGIIHAQARNCYLLAESVQSYNKFLADKGVPTKTATQLELVKSTAEAQLKKAKATIADLTAQELKGEMHRSEDVEKMTSDLIYRIRGALIALPGRLAVNLVGITTAAEVSDIIRKEVHLIMRELAEYKYDPKKYEERVRERMSWSTLGGVDDDE